HRSPHSNHSSPFRSGLLDGLNRLRPHVNPFLTHPMVLDPIHSNRLERSRSDMQGHCRQPYTTILQSFEQVGRKMQPCSGSCNSAFILCENRLIPITILIHWWPLDVLRQRHLAIQQEKFLHSASRLNPNRGPICLACHDDHVCVWTDLNNLSRSQFASDHNFPCVIGQFLYKQHLNGGT